MNKNSIKTVGILGGMGHYTTAMFFKNILDLTYAEKDCDNLRIIIDNNPQIPNCSRAILYDEESPVQKMIEGCKSLSSYPVDFIVIPSNSAAYFMPEVRKSVKTPVLDLLRITSEAFHNRYPGLERVVALGGAVTYLKQTYKNSLEKKGMQAYQYDEQVHVMVLNLIEKLKLSVPSDSLKQQFNTIVQNLKNNGVEGIILACTELTVFKNHTVDLPLVDSSYALAEELVQIALGRKVIPLDTEDVYAFWKRRSEMLSEGEVSDYQSTLLTIDTEGAEQRDSIEKERLFYVVNRYRDKFKGIAIEYGCGVGRITEALAMYFDRIDGIDYCSEFIEKAKRNAMDKNVNNVNYFVSSISEFIADQKYDCAICSGIIVYQDESQFLKLVSTIANNLAPSGICLLRESVGFQKRFELHGFYSSVLNSTYNAIYRTSEEIIDEFAKYGLTTIYEELTLPPTPDKPETCQKILILEKQKL